MFLFSKFPGGWDSCGVGHHCLGDFALAASGFPVHNLLCLQVLSGQEEKARPIHNLKSPVCVCVPHIRDSTVIKPRLVNSPPFSCQILEVPLCPDVELACPPVASAKAKHWCVYSCVKGIGVCSPSGVCGACRKLRVPGKELTQPHFVI